MGELHMLSQQGTQLGASIESLGACHTDHQECLEKESFGHSVGIEYLPYFAAVQAGLVSSYIRTSVLLGSGSLLVVLGLSAAEQRVFACSVMVVETDISDLVLPFRFIKLKNEGSIALNQWVSRCTRTLRHAAKANP